MGCGVSTTDGPRRNDSMLVHAAAKYDEYQKKISKDIDPVEREQLAAIIEQRKKAPKVTALAADDSLTHYQRMTQDAIGIDIESECDGPLMSLIVIQTAPTDSSLLDVKPCIKSMSANSVSANAVSVQMDNPSLMDSGSSSTSDSRRRSVSFKQPGSGITVRRTPCQSPLSTKCLSSPLGDLDDLHVPVEDANAFSTSITDIPPN